MKKLRFKRGQAVRFRAAMKKGKKKMVKGTIIQITDEFVVVRQESYVECFMFRDFHDKTVEIL